MHYSAPLKVDLTKTLKAININGSSWRLLRDEPFIFIAFKVFSGSKKPVSNSDIMHHLSSLFLFVFSAVSKFRFKQRQNAPIIVLIFKFPGKGWPTLLPLD